MSTRHEVAIIDSSAAIRRCTGTDHGERARRERHNLEIVGSIELPTATPAVIGEVISTTEWSAYATTIVPGTTRQNSKWSEVRTSLGMLVGEFGSLPTDSLAPVRDWCGGANWPDLVNSILFPSNGSLRRAAGVAVARLLDVEAGAPRSFVHGDFSLANVLFTDNEVSGIIDFDSAGIGDPAANLAPLLGAFGSHSILDIADESTVQRARAPRATLPLQVAVAADIEGNYSLRDHAIRNFSDRFESGTLEEPDVSNRHQAMRTRRYPLTE